MNKVNFLYNIFNWGCLALAVSTPVFLFYREFLSESSTIDYIELNTKSEGSHLRLSITQNSFIKSFIKFMLCLLSNIRPHVIFNKAVKFSQGIELAPKR